MQLIIIIKDFLTVAAFCDIVIINNKRCCHSIGSAPLILKDRKLKVMLYTAEDAIQIYHAKSSTLEFFCGKGKPKADWQGIRKEDIERLRNITVTILL